MTNKEGSSSGKGEAQKRNIGWLDGKLSTKARKKVDWGSKILGK
jgi:hypothetical protein